MLIKKLWKWLTISHQSKNQKGHPDLYPIDVSKLTAELNILEEARRLGVAGLPAHDAKSLSGPEAAIVQRVEKIRQDYIDWAVLRSRLLSDEIAKRDTTQAILRSMNTHYELEREATILITENEAHLRALHETTSIARDALERFKSANSLSRECKLSTTGAFLNISILIAIIVLEGFFNSFMFAQGVSNGLVGGFFYAGSAAFVNVITAYLLGRFCVRYVVHTSYTKKTFGFISLVLAACLMVMIGLGIAHIRDALTSDSQEFAVTALQSFIQSPFHLNDMVSYLLFGVSILCALTALIKGLIRDDMYPGYGELTKNYLNAVDEYQEEFELFRDDMNELKNRYLGSLDSSMKEHQINNAILESHINDKKSAHSRLNTALCNADNALDALIKKFRSENELHRGGPPRPTYFDELPPLKAIPHPDFSTVMDEQILKRLKNEVETLVNESPAIRVKIHEAFSKNFDRLSPLNDLIEKEQVI